MKKPKLGAGLTNHWMGRGGGCSGGRYWGRYSGEWVELWPGDRREGWMAVDCLTLRMPGTDLGKDFTDKEL